MIIQKFFRTFCAFFLIAGLAGCATSRLPKKAELAAVSQISELQFEDISRYNFMSVSYGRAGHQTMRPGGFVTTPDAFLLFKYQSKTDSFQTAFTLPYRDIQCVTTFRESTGKGVTSILTKDEVISVAAFLPDNDGMNFEAVDKMLSKFESKGILIFDAKMQVLNPLLSYSTYVQNPCLPHSIIPRKNTNSNSNEITTIRAFE